VNTHRIVVMGVSGCGKSTLGRALAAALRVGFVEGDEWHPPRNVALMAAGTPLTDDDRRDWLRSLAGRLGAAAASRQGLVLSCSALKRSYRDLLRTGAPGLRFVFLSGPPALVAERLHGRRGHYMPPSLLPSQFEALEPPQADEQAIELDITLPVADLVTHVLHRLETAPA